VTRAPTEEGPGEAPPPPAERRGILLTVAYDGRIFAGFAPQPGQRTISGELLGALQAVDPAIRHIRGASRTDAGVHAHGQRVAFDSAAGIPPKGWVLAVTRHLPREIAVRSASFVPPGFSPRFTSGGKRYRYLILRDPVRDPFLDGRAWRTQSFADAEAVARAQREARAALGTHDFAAFRSSADARTNTVRTVRAIDLVEDPHDARLLRVDIEGDAFLHNMVRILVGTFADVARGRLAEGAVTRALASRDRTDAGITAPGEGLYLEQVLLDEEGTGTWPAVTMGAPLGEAPSSAPKPPDAAGP
jgi:tRNA pseudouridine38-40 synthase